LYRCYHNLFREHWRTHQLYSNTNELIVGDSSELAQVAARTILLILTTQLFICRLYIDIDIYIYIYIYTYI